MNAWFSWMGRESCDLGYLVVNWSSRLGVEHSADKSTPNKITVLQKPAQGYEEDWVIYSMFNTSHVFFRMRMISVTRTSSLKSVCTVIHSRFWQSGRFTYEIKSYLYVLTYSISKVDWLSTNGPQSWYCRAISIIIITTMSQILRYQRSGENIKECKENDECVKWNNGLVHAVI